MILVLRNIDKELYDKIFEFNEDVGLYVGGMKDTLKEVKEKDYYCNKWLQKGLI